MAEKIVKDSQGLAKELVNDCISRKAAIDAIRASTSKYTGFMEMEMYTDDDAVEAIEALPSAQPKSYREGYQAGFKDAQPERKRGKWKMDLKRHVFVCSICGAWQVFNCNYCSNCGTDMREVDE